ncbi:MAG: hypothetical protein ACRD2F_12840, partial [Terriglobales bacterium]
DPAAAHRSSLAIALGDSMEHVDAKAIRERLHVVVLALATLESTATPGQAEAIAAAQSAVRDIALLVAGDEAEEHGQQPPSRLVQKRDAIRQDELGPPPGPSPLC